MGYIRQKFQDEIKDASGKVTQEGTLLKAEHLEHIEDGIVANEKAIEEKQPKGNYATEEFVTQKVSEAQLGGKEPDLSAYLTKTDADGAYQPKGNYLTEHQNMKTINGQSIVGEGDIIIGGDGSNAPVSVREKPVVSINHRGFSGVAPENTIPAYILSKQKGYKYVECDVSFTSDGVAVLLHDGTIDRTSNGTGKISAMTYEQASKYDYGYWKSPEYAGTHLPTFKEFIMLCKALDMHPYIELKSDGGYTKDNILSIVNDVKAHGMAGKVSYISFDATYLGYVKEVDPDARLGYVVSAITAAKLEEAVALRSGTNDVFIDAKYSSLTAANVNGCVSLGLPLEVWTVDDPSWFGTMHPYISGVTTDTLNAEDELYKKYIEYTPHTDLAKNVTGITLDVSSLNITTFDTQKLTATVEPSGAVSDIVWTSSDEDVAQVVDGVVTPHSSGTATITATAEDYSATCTVNVDVADLTAPDGYEAVKLLKATDIMYRVGTSWKPVDCDNNPPYTVAQNYRAGYYLTDIPVEYGYAYRVDFLSTHSGTMVGQQLANTKLMEYINNPSADISNETLRANLVDSGWLENGVDYVIPAEVNGYPLETMRITFKQGSSTYKGAEIHQVLISRKSTQQ